MREKQRNEQRQTIHRIGYLDQGGNGVTERLFSVFTYGLLPYTKHCVCVFLEYLGFTEGGTAQSNEEFRGSAQVRRKHAIARIKHIAFGLSLPGAAQKAGINLSGRLGGNGCPRAIVLILRLAAFSCGYY